MAVLEGFDVRTHVKCNSLSTRLRNTSAPIIIVNEQTWSLSLSQGLFLSFNCAYLHPSPIPNKGVAWVEQRVPFVPLRLLSVCGIIARARISFLGGRQGDTEPWSHSSRWRHYRIKSEATAVGDT